MNWNQEQYQQLTDHYRDLPDADLLHLAASPEDLTEIAEEVINKELAHRKLSPSAALVAPEKVSLVLDDERATAWRTYAEQAPSQCTFPYEDTLQAYHAQNFLAESGVFSRVLESSKQNFDLRTARVVVLPEDAERAAAILSQPIPGHIADNLEAHQQEETVEFVPPSCPACNTPDAVLIAVDPTNRWLCESCEHEWDDPA